MTQNQIAWHNAKETARHNLMTEQEMKRHQERAEQLQEEANALQSRNISMMELHYARQDAETQRSNRAKEIESFRSNIASEDIRNQANLINQAAVAETSRHQKEMERIQESLNESVISKNIAEISVASANAELLQEKVMTELANQMLTGSQMAYLSAQTQTEHQRPQNVRADTGLKQAKTFQSNVESAQTVVRTVDDALGILLPIVQ